MNAPPVDTHAARLLWLANWTHDKAMISVQLAISEERESFRPCPDLLAWALRVRDQLARMEPGAVEEAGDVLNAMYV